MRIVGVATGDDVRSGDGTSDGATDGEAVGPAGQGTIAATGDGDGESEGSAEGNGSAEADGNAKAGGMIEGDGRAEGSGLGVCVAGTMTAISDTAESKVRIRGGTG